MLVGMVLTIAQQLLKRVMLIHSGTVGEGCYGGGGVGGGGGQWDPDH